MRPPPESTTRRSFLKKGLLGGVLLTLGGAGLLATRSTRRVPLPPEPLRVLDTDEFAIVQALAERVIAPRPGTPTVTQIRVAQRVDAILWRADGGVRQEVKQLLRLFESGLAGFLFEGRTLPFTQLEPEAQDAVLRGWRDSRLSVRRTGYQALRALVAAAYYSSSDTHASVGYPGPPQGFHQPDAPEWRGGGQPRPEGNGVFHQEVDEGRGANVGTEGAH